MSIKQLYEKRLRALPDTLGYKDPNECNAVRAVFAAYAFHRRGHFYGLMPYREALTIRHAWTKHTMAHVMEQPQIKPLVDGLNQAYHTTFNHVIGETVSRVSQSNLTELSKKAGNHPDNALVLFIPKVTPHWHAAILGDKDKPALNKCFDRFMSHSIIGRIHLLLKSNMSTYQIHKLSEVAKPTIVYLRHGTRQVSNLSVTTALRLSKLYRCRHKHHFAVTLHGAKLVESTRLINANERLSFNRMNY